MRMDDNIIDGLLVNNWITVFKNTNLVIVTILQCQIVIVDSLGVIKMSFVTGYHDEIWRAANLHAISIGSVFIRTFIPFFAVGGLALINERE